MDERIAIRVSGLRPLQHVTLRATTPDSAGRTWRSEVIFVADSSGQIDTRRSPALGGSYTGVDPMGLVTAADIAGSPSMARYTAPGLVNIPLRVELVIGGRTVDSVTVLRSFMALTVRASPVHDPDGLEGTLFMPVGSNRKAGIVVLGGSEGGNSEAHLAAQLASHGYATLSVAYFGVDSLPSELDEIPLEYFEKAITRLRKTAGVDSTLIGLLGTSKGAEAALLVAARDSRIRVVVAFAPSSVVWSCLCSEESHSSWSLSGKPLPAVPPLTRTLSGSVPPYRPVIDYLYRLQHLSSAETILPVERIRAPVLLVAGDADQLWPSGVMAKEIRARLTGAGRSGDTVLIYPDAGHLIGKSYLPAGSTRIAGGHIETGGTPRANAEAQAAAWPEVLRFLSLALHSSIGR
jgi:dienelactone hydrolase